VQHSEKHVPLSIQYHYPGFLFLRLLAVLGTCFALTFVYFNDSSLFLPAVFILTPIAAYVSLERHGVSFDKSQPQFTVWHRFLCFYEEKSVQPSQWCRVSVSLKWTFSYRPGVTLTYSVKLKDGQREIKIFDSYNLAECRQMANQIASCLNKSVHDEVATDSLAMLYTQCAQGSSTTYTWNDMLGAVNHAEAYRKQGKHQKAIDSFTKVIDIASQLGPGDDSIRQTEVAKSYYNRGESYNALGYYQLAIDDFDRAIDIFELNPSDSPQAEEATRARAEASQRLRRKG